MRPPRKNRFRRILGTTVAVLLLLWFTPIWLANRNYDAEVARAKAEHIPLSFAEIPPGPPVQTSENAATDYAAAAKLFVEPKSNLEKFNTAPYWKVGTF